MSTTHNENRSIITDNHKESFDLHLVIREFALKYGVEEAIRSFDQAIVDLIENRFTDVHKVERSSVPEHRIAFPGDHKSTFYGENGVIHRCEEYAMSFRQIKERIEMLEKLGLDGYITGQSFHFPLYTFGIVAYEKGSYSVHSNL